MPYKYLHACVYFHFECTCAQQVHTCGTPRHVSSCALTFLLLHFLLLLLFLLLSLPLLLLYLLLPPPPPPSPPPPPPSPPSPSPPPTYLLAFQLPFLPSSQPLPGKQVTRYFDHTSDAFLEERQKALNKFLWRLTIHPYFSFSADLKVFLTAIREVKYCTCTSS